MARNNEAKIRFTAETGDFNEAINRANSDLTELRAELKLNAAQMENTGDRVAGLTKKQELLRLEAKAAQEKVEALSRKLEAAERIFGVNSDEASRLRTQLANARTAHVRLETAVRECTEELEQAGEASEDASDGYTILKDVISDLVSEAISWAIESFGELMTAADSALSLLGARAGSSSTELEKYKSVMDDIYRNNYGESFEDIAEAMGVALQTFGDLDDASLQNVTENAIALRDTFDMDYNESMRAVNSLMDQFGISADEAFNLIVQGAQNGLNQNDDLLDTINEYSVQFATAGYSADNMFNMLKNGVDSGTWSVDKLGDAVKEFNIRAKDGTVAEGLEEYKEQLSLTETDLKRLSEQMQKGGDDGKLAFGEILTALSGVKDETERYQIGVALFGTMWEDLGEDTVMALMHTKGEINSTKDAMDEMKDIRYNNLSDALSGLGRVLRSDILQPIVDVIAPIAKDIVTWCIEHINVLGPIIAGVAAALGAVAAALSISTIIAGVTKAFQLLNVTMLANPMMWLVALIAGLVAAFVVLWNNCEGFRNFWIGLWEKVKVVFTDLVEWLMPYITQLWENIKTAWEGIKTAVTEAVTVLQPIVSQVWETIKSTISVVMDAISTNITNVWTAISSYFTLTFETIKTIFSAAWDWIVALVTGDTEGIQTAITTIWEAIKGYFSGVFEILTTLFSSTWETIKTTTSTVFEAVKTVLSTIWGNIKQRVTGVTDSLKSAVSNAWETIKTTTSNVFNGLKTTVTTIWDGIKSAITTPIEAAKEKVSSVIEAIKGFFDFEFSWPHIPMPHFGISPPGWTAGDLLKGSIPKLGVEWYAEGGIMTKPTMFGMNGNNAMVGGEAGPEAILPINKLEDYIARAVENKMSVANLQALAYSIEDLASRPIQLNINGRQFALATAGDGDSVNGLRSTFKSRGLALD